MLTVVSISIVFATNPIKEGNMISGHVIVKGTEENIPYATILVVAAIRVRYPMKKDSSSSANFLWESIPFASLP